MSDTPADLILERQNRLGREMALLRDTMGSLTRMLALRFDMLDQHLTRIDSRLEDINSRLNSMEQTVRGYAGEQITMANGLLNVAAEASRAHRRLDGEPE